jgi:hypothetical protein
MVVCDTQVSSIQLVLVQYSLCSSSSWIIVGSGTSEHHTTDTAPKQSYSGLYRTGPTALPGQFSLFSSPSQVILCSGTDTPANTVQYSFYSCSQIIVSSDTGGHRYFKICQQHQAFFALCRRKFLSSHIGLDTISKFQSFPISN